MHRFAVYEEFGANYELVQRDIENTQRAIAAWPDFDRAIEVLSAHVNPVRSREANRRKALTVKDLLIKVCQFSHLFGRRNAENSLHSQYSASLDTNFCSVTCAT